MLINRSRSVEYYHYCQLIAVVKMDRDHCLDLIRDAVNFVANNWIEIEDLTARHDTLLLISKHKEIVS